MEGVGGLRELLAQNVVLLLALLLAGKLLVALLCKGTIYTYTSKNIILNHYQRLNALIQAITILFHVCILSFTVFFWLCFELKIDRSLLVVLLFSDRNML